jgi:hypothetical protein
MIRAALLQAGDGLVFGEADLVRGLNWAVLRAARFCSQATMPFCAFQLVVAGCGCTATAP